MSRAFVSEEAADAAAAQLPERPVSSAQNLVTPLGLALIREEVSRLEALHAATELGSPERAAADRDLRYWRARDLSAVLVPSPTGAMEDVTFGCRVTVRRGDAASVSYTIVGEDEAEPSRGLLSWTSPLADALLGARAGEVVDVGGGRPPVTVVKIETH